jgi:Bacterial dnaA protein helix-turn-helix
MSRAGYYIGRQRERDWVLQIAGRAIDHLHGVKFPTPKIINIVIAYEFQITPVDITGRSLWCIDVAARQIAMTLTYLTTHYTTKQLGEHFGKVDHTTILHAYRKYSEDVIALCNTHGVPVYVRAKGEKRVHNERPHRKISKRRKLFWALKALELWKDAPAIASDIFKNTTKNKSVGLMCMLRNHGYAVGHGSHTMWWQITESGLKVLQSLTADKTENGLGFAPHGAGRNFSRTAYMRQQAHKTEAELVPRI